MEIVILKVQGFRYVVLWESSKTTELALDQLPPKYVYGTII